jgi:hypothetical protein
MAILIQTARQFFFRKETRCSALEFCAFGL